MSLLTIILAKMCIRDSAHIVSSASRGAVTDFWNMEQSGKQ